MASYNAGAGNVRKWLRENGDPRGGTDVVTWIEAIPFSEAKAHLSELADRVEKAWSKTFFTRAFGRRFGLSPSTFRTTCRSSVPGRASASRWGC